MADFPKPIDGISAAFYGFRLLGDFIRMEVIRRRQVRRSKEEMGTDNYIAHGFLVFPGLCFIRVVFFCAFAGFCFLCLFYSHFL